MINTSQSPNTQQDDFNLGAKVLLNPSSYLKGNFPQLVSDWFQRELNTTFAVTYESARTGMYFALKELGVEAGDEVIIQAFTCVAAVNPIKWAGAQPVYADIDPTTFNMDIEDFENKITENTRGVIVQHTFGYPAKMDAILSIARKRGLFVMEDCSHTIGGEYNGEKLGTLGDVGVFSLGRDKGVSASFGGVVVTNNKTLGEKLKTAEKFLSYPKKSWVFTQIFFTITTYLSMSLNDVYIGRIIHLLSRRFTRRDSTTLEEKKNGAMPEHAKSRLPNALARVALHQLEKIAIINRKRHEFSSLYVKLLTPISGPYITLPSWKLGKTTYPLRFPLLVKDSSELRQFAWAKRIMLGDWYDVPVAPKSVDLIAAGYKNGSCPKAEEVCKKVVNLPLHINLSENDVRSVVSTIKEFYNI